MSHAYSAWSARARAREDAQGVGRRMQLIEGQDRELAGQLRLAGRERGAREPTRHGEDREPHGSKMAHPLRGAHGLAGGEDHAVDRLAEHG